VDTSGKPTLPTASTVSDFLSTLKPLAFISQNPPSTTAILQDPFAATAKLTQLYDPNADTFLYAVGVSSEKFVAHGLTHPDMVYFFYEDLFRNNLNFANGTTVAKFSFPLTVLTKDTAGNFIENAVPTTLNFVATNAGDCSMSKVVSTLWSAPGISPSQIGL